MPSFVGPRARKSGEDDMRVRVERKLHAKIWQFDFVTPQAQWEDLFGWNAPDTPKRSAGDAYDHAKPFWDDVAERIADALAKDAREGVPVRRAQVISPNLDWLQDQYQTFQARQEA